ncbi:glycoside hydrolase family 36 protein [Bacillus sp. FJAT-26390]|uniref:glycoside hydrolase family 36 protein n=1 Tax=Bacillus sp. FJAT-26390 TaxID=1743142 RepID=UPI000A5ED343|nr:glycoside hydrolase family 36 protein [Bacillus sp. FJAT-26390]
MITVSTKKHQFMLASKEEGETENRFAISLAVENKGDGIDVIRLIMKAEQLLKPPVLTLRWQHPADDIQASWHPAQDRNKSFKADWMRDLRANAATSAPVYSLFNLNGNNRLTYAFSDALHTTHYAGGIREETAEFHCSIQLFKEPTAPLKYYEAALLVDTRDIPYYESLQNVQNWWSEMPAFKPAAVPDEAKRPMYSTWYSMHQNVTAESVEAECEIARSLGMDAVIVDDGWQTEDNRRGYAYTGDWEPCESKFPDMAGHVSAVHALGMKIVLWYAVPYVGKHSKAWDRFQNKLVRYNENSHAGVLDPRYPEVREYIIHTYEKAVKEWNLDGFKLDFIDAFYSPELQQPSTAEGRDCESIPAAVDRLLTDSLSRLRAIKPDIMVEFRQPYVGPAMRKYGNMFRASDCPYDSIQNRVRTLDIRLLCGDTAAHADMIMWHPEEPVESAALQLINLLFSVPQISMPLHSLPDEHRRMLRYWLGFWSEHRNVLLDGKLAPGSPELLYPVVQTSKAGKTIIATYHDAIVPLSSSRETDASEEWIIVNGRLKDNVYAEVTAPLGKANVVISNCCGNVVSEHQLHLAAGLHKLPIPPSGTAVIRMVSS